MKDQHGAILTGALIGLAMVFVFAVLGAIFWQVSKHFGVNNASEFGDMFGGANALFSGLAFVGIIGTLILQGREFQRHRETLEMSADVALFEYCNSKISSLRQATYREKKDDNCRQERINALNKDIVAFLELHEKLRASLASRRKLEFPRAHENTHDGCPEKQEGLTNVD